MIVLIGESGSGKTVAEAELVEIGYKKSISDTSREPRTGEIDGVSYFFRTKEKMEQLNAEGYFAEYIPYLGNFYGLSYEQCTNDRIVVVEPRGLAQLLEKENLDIQVIYLKTSEEVRASRMLSRGDKFDNVVDRIFNDREIFKDISSKADFVIDTDKLTIEEIVLKIDEIHKKVC